MNELRPQQLIDALLDDTLDAAGLATLESWLAADPEHPRILARQSILHGHMRSLTAGRPMERPAGGPRHTRSANPRSAFRVPSIAYPLAAAVLLAAAGVAIYVATLDATPEAEDRTIGAPLAMVTYAAGLITTDADATLAEGDSVGAQWLYAGVGETELTLTSGTQINLAGPARLRLDSAMAVALEVGEARFVCPPQAVGFTVELPGGVRAVDLGTQFVVTADEDGASVLRVTEGRVRLHTPDGEVEAVADTGWRYDEAGGLRPITVRVPLVNGDFEAPAIDDFEASPQRLKPAAGWTVSGSLVAVYNPDRTFYPGAGVTDADGGVLAHMSGPQALFMFGTGAAWAEQSTGHRVAAGKTYTLTAAIGRRLELRGEGPAVVEMQMLAGGRVLASLSIGPRASQAMGTFADAELRYAVGADDPAIGQPLTIRLGRAASQAAAYADFDHVRLTHEPSDSRENPSPDPEGDRP